MLSSSFKLQALISKRIYSPIWIISEWNNFLNNSAKAMCLRLIEIGGVDIVYRTGFEDRYFDEVDDDGSPRIVDPKGRCNNSKSRL